MNDKKILLGAIFSSVLLFSGCSTGVDGDVVDSSLPDLTNLYAQVCESKSGPCLSMSCQLEGISYICAESISDREKKCSSEKSLDDIFKKYKICGNDQSFVEGLDIYSYGPTLESVTLSETPEKLEQKIKEEKEVVENGGTSDFLSTMMAVAGGSIIGGMISNAMFGQKNAMPPARPEMSNERPMNKESLKKAESETKANNEKVKSANKQTKSQSQKRSDKKKSSSAAKKKSSSKRTRRKGRR
jgi:hypothetical protein